jgi:hypothetical protein
MEFVVFTIGTLAYWNLADYLEATSRNQRELLRNAVILDEDAWTNLSEF